MKNLITLSLLILSISAFGQKQYIGLRGGNNWTNYYEDGEAGKYDYQTGLNFGMTYEYEFQNNFHLEIDLLFAQKGFQYKGLTLISADTDPNGFTIIKFKHFMNYNYLSLPIKGGYSIGKKLQGFLNLGAVPSVLINSTKATSTSGEIGSKLDHTDATARIDLSGMVEIGCSYKLKEQFVLFTSFSYQQSFTYLHDYDPIDVARHFGMVLSLGVKYKIGE